MDGWGGVVPPLTPKPTTIANLLDSYTKLEDGYTEVTLNVAPKGMKLFVMQYADRVEVMEPTSLRVGVSGLTRAILQTGDVRLLRAALDRGLIPAEEPTDRLLRLAGKNTAARAAGRRL